MLVSSKNKIKHNKIFYVFVAFSCNIQEMLLVFQLQKHTSNKSEQVLQNIK